MLLRMYPSNSNNYDRSDIIGIPVLDTDDFIINYLGVNSYKELGSKSKIDYYTSLKNKLYKRDVFVARKYSSDFFNASEYEGNCLDILAWNKLYKIVINDKRLAINDKTIISNSGVGSLKEMLGRDFESFGMIEDKRYKGNAILLQTDIFMFVIETITDSMVDYSAFCRELDIDSGAIFNTSQKAWGIDCTVASYIRGLALNVKN